MAEIEEILKGDKPPVEEKAKAEVVSDPVEKPESETPEKPEAEAPEAPAPEEKPEAAPEPGPSREVSGLKAANTAERKKRQQAEAEREELRQELDKREQRWRQDMQQMMAQFAPKPPETPAPNVFEDPEGWQRQQSQTYEQRLRQTEVKMSERLARVQYGDDVYSEAEREIENHYRNNPNDPIFVAIQRSDDPAGVMVQWHQNRQKLNDLSDPETLIEKQLATASPEFKAKLLSMLGGQSAEPKSATPAPSALPSNLAGARSVRGQGKVFTGAQPIGDILKTLRK